MEDEARAWPPPRNGREAWVWLTPVVGDKKWGWPEMDILGRIDEGGPKARVNGKRPNDEGGGDTKEKK